MTDHPDSTALRADADHDAAVRPPEPDVRRLATSRRRLVSAGHRIALSGMAALLVLVALTPAGRGEVAEALDAFRGERLEVVTVDADAWAASVDPEQLRALATLGELDVSGVSEPEEVADVAEAEAVSGISAPSPAAAPDRLVALEPGTVRLELTATDTNGVPARLDGAALLVEVPGAIGAIYGPADGPPEVVVARSGSLVVRAEGAPLEAFRSFLLSHRELPEELRAQLAAIGDWRSTIPVPVPVDGPSWEEVEVAGRPAIAFGDDSGIGAIVIRQDPDGVTVVVGRVGVSQALELAAEA